MRAATNPPPVIIIGAHTVGLAILRALDGHGMARIVLSYDHADMGRVSRHVTTLIDCPHPENEAPAFLSFLEHLAPLYPGALLLPASDAALAGLARWKDRLSDRFQVGCADPGVVAGFIDKKRTYALAAQMGVSAPRTLVPQSEAEARTYAETALFPCLVKPCQSHRYFEVFHCKMVRAANPDELLTAYRAAAAAGLEVVLQEYIPGGDDCGVNYNAYFWDGQARAEFTARKWRNAPPELGSPCVVQSATIPEVIEPGRRILAALGFNGFACTEFKRDPRDGVYKLMEVNGRHNLSGHLAVSCGLNFPLLHYRHLMFGELPSPTPYRQDVYWIDLTRDLAYHLRRVLRGELTLRAFLAPYRGKHTFAILDRRDLRPFLKRLGGLLGSALRGERSI
jgi:predicted ATP-grasp superfamily ATP-dependent carboligase